MQAALFKGHGAAHFKAQGTSILCVKIERKLYLGMAALDNPVEGNVVEHLTVTGGGVQGREEGSCISYPPGSRC